MANGEAIGSGVATGTATSTQTKKGVASGYGVAYGTAYNGYIAEGKATGSATATGTATPSMTKRGIASGIGIATGRAHIQYSPLKRDRNHIYIVEIDLDYCSLTCGSSPCTSTESEKCYNTRATCQDTDNYDKETKTYRFTDSAPVPVGLNCIPAVKKVSFGATRITMLEGLGYRGKATVTLADFPHDDVNIDKYVDDRSYTPEEQGSFFGRLIARNPYYAGRLLRIKTGYLRDAYIEDNFEQLEYVIENISVSQSGDVTIIAKDILKKLDGERTQVPASTSSSLLVDITSSTESIYLNEDMKKEFDASTLEDVFGHVRINDEIIKYTIYQNNDNMTFTERGAFGTEISDHSLDDGMQRCKVWENHNVVDIIYEILTEYGDIDTDYIDYDTTLADQSLEWNIQRTEWLPDKIYTTVLSESESAKDLIEELTLEAMIMLWWDERTQKIRLKAIQPPIFGEEVFSAVQGENIIANSARISRADDKRYSQAWVNYGVVDWSDIKKKNKVYIKADLEKEEEALYGEKRVKQIDSRWIADSIMAKNFASRFLGNFADTPIQYSFDMDFKDSTSLKTGDLVDVKFDSVQSAAGVRLSKQCVVIECKEKVPGAVMSYVAQPTGYFSEEESETEGDYAYIGYDGLPDYMLCGGSVEDAAYTSVNFATGTWDADSMRYNDDGTKFYILDKTNDYLYEYDLTTAYDISTMSYYQSEYLPITLDSQSLFQNVQSFCFSANGSVIFMYDHDRHRVGKMLLSTPFDISTIYTTASTIYEMSIDRGSVSIMSDLWLSPDGLKLIIADEGISDGMFEMTMTSSLDILTGTYTKKTTNRQVARFGFDSTGKVLITMDYANSYIYQFSLTTAWDILTMNGNYTAISTTETSFNQTGMVVNVGDGESMLIHNTTDNRIEEWGFGESVTGCSSEDIAEGEVYAWICEDSGFFGNGDPGDKII